MHSMALQAQLKRKQAEITCGSLPLAEILEEALHSTRHRSAWRAGTVAAVVHATSTLNGKGSGMSSVLQTVALSEHLLWQDSQLLTSKWPLSFWVACRTRF